LRKLRLQQTGRCRYGNHDRDRRLEEPSRSGGHVNHSGVKNRASIAARRTMLALAGQWLCPGYPVVTDLM
jgi:hypothetical protein